MPGFVQTDNATLMSSTGFEVSIITMGADALTVNARNALAVSSMQMGYNGVTADMVRVANVARQASVAALAVSGTLAVWTPAAGKKFRLHGFLISVSAATVIAIQDSTGSSIASFYMTANSSIVVELPKNGYLSLAANNTLYAKNVGGVIADVAVSAFGNEE